MIKISKSFYIGFLALSSLAFAVESEVGQVNEKFAFVKEIYDDSWALIIGINKYQNVEPLSYAVNDAVAVKEMFVNKYGFKEENIKLITDEDATKDNIIKGFSDILTQAKERDRVVVFYAGHGETYKLPSGGDMGYLIPVDGNLENLYLSSIPMKSVYDIADMSYAKHILYLVDACYGGLTLSKRGFKKDHTPEYLRQLTKEKGRQVITAGGKDEQVIEKPEWGHSAFTRNLLAGLGKDLADENMDGIITGDELGGFIKNRVIVDVDGAHTPQKGRIGSEMGEFVFISETLEEELASADDGDLGAIKEQMATQQQQMAQLTELLLAQSKAQSQPQPQTPSPVIKPKKTPKIKTASTLAWLFPGMGHFYSGRPVKGMFYTGLELASLAAVGIFGNSYDDRKAKFEKADELARDAAANPYNYTTSEKNDILQEREDEFKKYQGEMYSLIGAGTLSAVIWVWNIRDVKKSNKYSSYDPVSIGVNSRGQVEARISF